MGCTSATHSKEKFFLLRSNLERHEFRAEPHERRATIALLLLFRYGYHGSRQPRIDKRHAGIDKVRRVASHNGEPMLDRGCGNHCVAL